MTPIHLTPAVRTFLDEPRYATIASINESGMPQLTAIWYVLEGEEVIMNTAAGTLKHRNLQRDPRLALCIVDGERYVTLYGRAALGDDREQAQADEFQLAVRYAGLEAATRRAPEIARQERVTIRMTLTHVQVLGIE